MREIQACVSPSDLSFQWQVSQELLLVLSDDRGAESSRRFRHILITRSASRVFAVPDRVIVVPAHYNGGLRPYQIHYFSRFWAVIDEVPENPKLVEVIGQRPKSFTITVHIRNNRNLHKLP